MSAYSAYAQSGFSNQTLSNSVIVARATMQATLDALIH